jgi:hypothetical protein
MYRVSAKMNAKKLAPQQEADRVRPGQRPQPEQPKHADGGTRGADAAPDAQRLVALGALAEHVHHNRQRGRQHHGGAEALDASHDDQEGVAGGQRAGQ